MIVAAILAAGVAAGGTRAGAASADITPPAGHPMWGYAARKDGPCVGVLDRLNARALVIDAGGGRAALVSLDLGRPPTRQSTARIRAAAKRLGIDGLFLAASHTHHGPVLELGDWPRGGKPYVEWLEETLISLLGTAVSRLKPARVGAAAVEVPYNRNRQSREPDAPRDRRLTVVRVETPDGEAVAHAVHFAAHPTMRPSRLMKFSADFPGPLCAAVEAATGAPCLYLQGASGDLSAAPPAGAKSPEAFGELLAGVALKLTKRVKCEPVDLPRVRSHFEAFRFKARLPIGNPIVGYALGRAFFPELVAFFEREYKEGVRPQLNVTVVNDRLALVGVSGEVFCGHALSLRRRSGFGHVLIIGCCNDYHQYFPTVEAAARGGYGTAVPIAMAELGSGERVMTRALLALFRLTGRLPGG